MASSMPQANTNGDDDKIEGDNKEIIPGYSDVNVYSQTVLRSVLSAVKASNDLPTGDDFDFYSSFRAVRDVLDVEASRVLSLIQTILRHQGVKGNISQTSDDVEIEDKFDVLIDANDQILERAGTSLDEASGVRKNESKLVVAVSSQSGAQKASWNKSKTSSASPACRLLSAKNILRPQLKFKDAINNDNAPFIPSLHEKPNARKPLDESLRLPEGVTTEMAASLDFLYPHPYAYEIDHLEYLPRQLEPIPYKMPLPLEDTPFTMVTELSQLESLLQHLKQQEEFAVDLEAHSYRSFQGFTCLMQVSSKTEDFLVDTIALRSDMHILNEVFTDPTITKVFHGGDSDIVWLQRDFGIYVVNMFDTGQAARVLSTAHFSLKHLLEIYCGISVDKFYQLADWRIRPLSPEMMEYARTDSHYLLYIASRMKTQVLEKGNAQKNLLMAVYQRSANISKLVYRKPVYRDTDWEDLLRKKQKMHYNSQQRQALRDIHAWRDKTARREDEGLQYVLPDHMMFKMCENLPRELQGVLACCDPIPHLVRREATELHRIIVAARDTPILKVEKAKKKRESVEPLPSYDASSPLTCPHDWSHPESADSCQGKKNMRPVQVLDTPVLSVFASTPKTKKSEAAKKAAEIRASFEDPFFKYLPAENSASPTSANSSQNASSTSPSMQELHALPFPKGMWRLKAHTQKKRKASSTADAQTPVFAPPKKRVRIDTAAPPLYREEEVKRGQLSLKDQVLEERKRKKKKRGREDLEGVILEKKKKLMPTILGEDLEMEQSEDTAESQQKGAPSFEYTAADQALLEGGSKKKHDVFDPTKSLQADKSKTTNKIRQPKGMHKRNKTFKGPRMRH